MPSRLRIELFEFDLVLGYWIADSIEDEEPRARGAVVDGPDVPSVLAIARLKPHVSSEPSSSFEHIPIPSCLDLRKYSITPGRRGGQVRAMQ